MPITEAEYGASLPVDGYGPGFFRVAGQVYWGGIVVEAGSVTPWAGYDERVPLLALSGKVDVLFVGTGPEIAFLPKDFVRELEAVGVMCEPMATPSAARTYNVLLSEGRRVAAALIAMPEGGAG
ncbi:Mth938-like domain-containing protein [Sedimentimonas flavescens]|uniref:Mth938-like domain-containing protein n=1 Tax=Sedimentimonas flavescens TaxID=2851012 RepID=UPI001C49CDC0|nr:Mth938-like domain-containing protein [Sedimentimonas flavescens]MBW0157179.1 Mth938-like domain-containing protein [Sedimentimonas flavescens]